MPDGHRLMTELSRTRVRSVRTRAPRHRVSSQRRHRVLRGVATVVVFFLAFSVTAVALAYGRLQGNINQVDLESILGANEPTGAATSQAPTDENAGRALNILLIGSDTREGDNDVDGAGASGTTSGMRSDTTMIVHISADRTRVDVVSIPRDTLVTIPSCPLPDGTSSDETYGMFNSAFQTGGATGDIGYAAACTILTVQNLTGLTIDDFAVVDFAGFKNVVDALGGIPVQIDENIDDDASGLHITAGCRLLDGEQALAYARVRHNVGDGSDISRIGRQQQIVDAIIGEALDTSLLSDPARLYRVLDTATQTLTTGETIGNIPAMVGLASSLSSFNLSNLVLTTMPFYYQGARVVPAEEYDGFVWDAIRNDTPLDPIYTGEGSTIAQALAEREAAASQAATDAAANDTATTDTAATDTAAPATSETATAETATPGASETASAPATTDTPSDSATAEVTSIDGASESTAPVCTKENAS